MRGARGGAFSLSDNIPDNIEQVSWLGQKTMPPKVGERQDCNPTCPIKRFELVLGAAKMRRLWVGIYAFGLMLAVSLAAGGLPCRSCVIDGEVAICDERGLAVFDRLRTGPQVKPEAFLYAFDLLELDGEDLRRESLEGLEVMLSHVRNGHAFAGIHYVEHIAGDGPEIFAAACGLGCEGIVSKRLASKYKAGRSRDWLKIKNPDAPWRKRLDEEDWGR